jgi:hypothetical protein
MKISDISSTVFDEIKDLGEFLALYDSNTEITDYIRKNSIIIIQEEHRCSSYKIMRIKTPLWDYFVKDKDNFLIKSLLNNESILLG